MVSDVCEGGVAKCGARFQCPISESLFRSCQYAPFRALVSDSGFRPILVTTVSASLDIRKASPDTRITGSKQIPVPRALLFHRGFTAVPVAVSVCCRLGPVGGTFVSSWKCHFPALLSRCSPEHRSQTRFQTRLQSLRSEPVSVLISSDWNQTPVSYP